MVSRDAISTDYRGYNIAINPSGKRDNALTDAFMIFEPTVNPMLTRTLYEHPLDKIKTYGTEDEARNAAIQLAREWLDKYLARSAG